MTENTTVYVNAVVFDGLADAPLQSAFAVRGDRILAVGAEDEVRAAAGPDVAVVDLDGAFAMPGVIEAHAHLAMSCSTSGRVPRSGTAAASAWPGSWLWWSAASPLRCSCPPRCGSVRWVPRWAGWICRSPWG